MRAGHPRSTTHAGLRRTAIPLVLCLNRAYGRSRRYAALDDARSVCTGNASHCGHVRDSALPGVSTRLCVLLQPCARFCIAGRIYAFMRPIAAMCAILHCRAYLRVYASSCNHVRDSASPGVSTRLCVPLRPCARFCIAGRMYAFMCPIATLCTILRRAYVHAYASSCGHVHDSASPGVCTRLCVLLRPCARFCVAGRMYAFMRPLATMCAILRRAYVRVYASSCDRARDSAPGVCTRLCLRAATLPGIRKYQCIPLRAFAYTCARKNQDIFSRASNQNFSSGKMPARMPMRQVTSGSTICAISRSPTRLISIAM